MAKSKFIFEGQDLITPELKKIKASLDEFKNNVKTVQDSIKSLAEIAVVAKGFDLLKDKVGESLQKFVEFDKSVTRFNFVANNMGSAIGVSKQALDQIAETVSNNSLFDGDAVRDLETLMFSFDSLNSEIYQRSIPIISDLASRMGIDLVQAGQAVGSALETPEKALKTLKAANVTLNDEQTKTIQHFIDLGDKAGFQSSLLDILAQKTRGAGEELANSASGGIVKAQQGIDDLDKAFGKIVATIAGPFAGAIAQNMNDFANEILNTTSETDALTNAISKQISENAKNATQAKQVLGPINEKNVTEKITLDQYDALIKIYPDLIGKIDAYKTSVGEADEAVKKLNSTGKENIYLKLAEDAMRARNSFQDTSMELAKLSSNLNGSWGAKSFKFDQNSTAGLEDLKKQKAQLEQAMADPALQAKITAGQYMLRPYLDLQELLDKLIEKKKLVLQAEKNNSNFTKFGNLEGNPTVVGAPARNSTGMGIKEDKPETEADRIKRLTAEAQADAQRLQDQFDQQKEYWDKVKALEDAAHKQAEQDEKDAYATQMAIEMEFLQREEEERKKLTDYLKNDPINSYFLDNSKTEEETQAIMKTIKENMKMDGAIKDFVSTIKAGIEQLQPLTQAVGSLFNELANVENAKHEEELNRIQAEFDVWDQAQQLKIAKAKANGDDTRQMEFEYLEQKAKKESELAKKQAEEKKRAFDAEKQAKIISTTMATAQAVMQAFAGTPYPWSIPLALLVGAAGAAQIGVIAGQSAPQFETGGVISGSSTSGDRLLIRANAKERVLTAEQNNNLEAIANGSGGQAIVININNPVGTIDSEFAVKMKEIFAREAFLTRG